MPLKTRAHYHVYNVNVIRGSRLFTHDTHMSNKPIITQLPTAIKEMTRAKKKCIRSDANAVAVGQHASFERVGEGEHVEMRDKLHMCN